MPRSPARLRASRAKTGFTVVELMIALAIAGSLLLLTGTTLHTWIARYQQRNAADALVQALNLTRGEALKRSARVSVCASRDGATCDPAGRWDLGWLVFGDSDGDGDRDVTEDIVRTAEPA